MKYFKKLWHFIKTQHRWALVVLVNLYILLVGLVSPVILLYSGGDPWQKSLPPYVILFICLILGVPLLAYLQESELSCQDRLYWALGVLTALMVQCSSVCALADPNIPPHHVVKGVTVLIIIGWWFILRRLFGWDGKQLRWEDGASIGLIWLVVTKRKHRLLAYIAGALEGAGNLNGKKPGDYPNNVRWDQGSPREAPIW